MGNTSPKYSSESRSSNQSSFHRRSTPSYFNAKSIPSYYNTAHSENDTESFDGKRSDYNGSYNENGRYNEDHMSNYTDDRNDNYYEYNDGYNNRRNENHNDNDYGLPFSSPEETMWKNPNKASDLKLRLPSTASNAISGYKMSASQIENVERRRIALLFGNNAYPGDNRLLNSCKDAIDMSEKLETLGFECTVVTNARKNIMKTNVKAFRNNIREGDCVLLYFSGHGMENEGINYLVPIYDKQTPNKQVKIIQPPSDYISLSGIMKQLNQQKGVLNIIILDACRSDRKKSTFRSRSDLPSRRAKPAFGKAMSKSIEAPNNAEYFIVFSCDPGKFSYGTEQHGQNSIFTAALLNNIDRERITIEDMMKETSKELYKLHGDQQRPWWSSCSREIFYFNP